MKKLLWASALLTSLFVIGCDTGSNSTGNIGATATAYGACPAGYWYSNGMCSNGQNTINSTFSFSNGFYADNYSGYASSFRIVNIDKMKQLFKLGMGVCDRGDKNYQNIGSANCDYYISGYVDLVLQFPSQGNGAALITIIAKPRTNPYGANYSGQLPSGWGLVGIALGYVTGYTFPDPSYYQGAYRDPLQIQAAVSLVNDVGFVAQGYGDAWTGLNQTLVTIEVLNGTSNSQNLNYTLKIGGVAAATGTMARCQYQNCGL